MMKETTARKRLLLLLSGVFVIAAVIICIFLLPKQSSRISPVKGTLDLQGWSIQRDGPLSLSGQWYFYWDSFLTYREIVNGSRKPDVIADVPGVWNAYSLQGKNLPGSGHATYRLKVVNAPEGMPLSLRIPTFSTAYELYIDDLLISSNGKAVPSRERYWPEYRPRVVEFTPAGTSFELIIHVANFTYARGGMWYAVNMGTPEQIRKMDRVILYKDLLLSGALSVMALYYLSIFLLRREDRSSLFLVLMCVVFVFRTLVYGDYLIKSLIPFISFNAVVAIDYSTLCWFSVFAALLIGEMFPEETSKKILKAFSAYAAAMTLVFLTTPVSFFTRLSYIIEVTAVLIGLYAIVCVSAAFVKGRKDSLLVLLGTLPVIAGGVHDVLYQNNIVLSDFGELVPIGLFLLLFMQSFVLARRFSEAFSNVSALSQKLLKLDKVKDEFLANTSHELRTPLSGILGIAEALLRGSGNQLNGTQRQSLSIIAGTSRRLANLVNDILDYSKLKHGDISLNIRPVRLDGLIQTVVNVFKQLSRSKEYDVISDIPAGLPPVMADENRVVQILYNLLGNAVKFTARGQVKVSARKVGNMLEICVSDTGEGIPEDRLEDIFKSFEQVDTSLTRRHGGTGLGLSITKQLVELQGGGIRVQTQFGAGSAFYFTLPAASALPEEKDPAVPMLELAASAAGEQPAAIKKEGDGAHVLLVDDDAVSLHSSAAILKIGGYAVTAVNSGKAALEVTARQQDCSLVVLDVMMPEMSGYEVCRRIREHKTSFDLPVLMLTAKATTGDIVMGFEAGASDYLSKPFEPEELLARVRTLVNLKISVDRSLAAEVAFMQAQIKPHFLYNTLNTISFFCDADPGRARMLIDDFSNYLRHSFDSENLEMYVPVEREISLVNSYVEIEKARFGSRLKVEFNIDSTIKAAVPSLTIQPLVENAIRHGLRKKGGGGTVVIWVKKTGEGVMVSVSDDGAGIPPDRLETILSPDTGQGVGLRNIDRRLKKLLGKGLTIESKPGEGTRVTFILPPEGF